jgi:C_GCAxxG_C_C family probable redox protein
MYKPVWWDCAMANNNRELTRTDRICLSEGQYTPRRDLLQVAGAGLLGLLATKSSGCAALRRTAFKPLNENACLDVGDRAEEIIEQAYKLGHDFEKEHGGCCRCTVAALQNALGFIPLDKDLFRAASCLDGGATPTGIQNCGSFTGSGMVIGWVCGANEFGKTKLSHKLIRQVYDRFEKDYGTVICKDIKKNMDRKCPEVVARAAKWTAEVLLGQFTDYKQAESSS